MTDATSIESLPGPASQQSNNIKMDVKEVGAPPVPPTQKSAVDTALQGPSVPIAPAQVDPNAMGKVMAGLQQAHMQGMTTLPARDIPMPTTQFTQDKQIKPNYVPETENTDYIKEEETYETMMQKKREKMEQEDRLDMLYDELQMPVLLMVLYFLFQMPFFQKKFRVFFPSMFKNDGVMTMGGYVFKTFLFGTSFYLINKLGKYASEL